MKVQIGYASGLRLRRIDDRAASLFAGTVFTVDAAAEIARRPGVTNLPALFFTD